METINFLSSCCEICTKFTREITRDLHWRDSWRDFPRFLLGGHSRYTSVGHDQHARFSIHTHPCSQGVLQGSASQEHSEIVDSSGRLQVAFTSPPRESVGRLRLTFSSTSALFRHLGVNNAGRYIVSRWRRRTCSSVIYAVETSITYCPCMYSQLRPLGKLLGHSTGCLIQLMPTIQSVDTFW